jgi:hypothetical protein
MDNVGPARPHTGLESADVVYIEQVEAGQSRILSVYSSKLPSKVGPVRSARESDMELLRQFGEPALAYSGSQSALKPLIAAAPLHALPPERAPKAYERDNSRMAPHNLYLRPTQALAAAPRATNAKDIGFRFGPAPAGGVRDSHHTVRYPAARFDFTWSEKDRRWLVAMDGTPSRNARGSAVGASTVVIQNVDIHPSKFKDRWGSISPYTETVGSGTATVLRDGKSFQARWSRPNAEAGTTFTTPSGQRMNFAAGQVWVVLAEH